MRILILATDVFTRGGIARYTSTLASALGEMLGPENVDVVSFFDWGGSQSEPAKFRFLGAVSDRPRAGVVSRLRFLLKVAGVGPGKYDLVIANHVALAPAAALIKLIFGTPYWVVCHSVEVWWGTSRIRRAALRSAGLILPVSRYTSEKIAEMGGIPHSRMKLLYNAIPDSFSSLLSSSEPASHQIPELKNSGVVLLSVCKLVAENEFKGVDAVIQVLPKILRGSPGARYAVAGAGEFRTKLERLASETGVAESVVFLGEVTDAQLAALYRRCDVFVLPSRGQENHGREGGEGFGRVYAEAALAGKPVVASRMGGAPEAVFPGKTGLLVDPLSSDEIAAAVLALLQNPELAARMGSEGRRRAQKSFSEDALRRSLAELLRHDGFSVPALPRPFESSLGMSLSSFATPVQVQVAHSKGES